jgi:hypothetical protein
VGGFYLLVAMIWRDSKRPVPPRIPVRLYEVIIARERAASLAAYFVVTASILPIASLPSAALTVQES